MGSLQNQKIGWDAVFFLFALSLWPHMMVLHQIVPIRAFGKSIWLGLFVVGFVFFAIKICFQTKNKDYIYLLLISLFTYLLALIFRMDIFHVNLFSEMILLRPLILFPLCVVVTHHFMKQESVANLTLWIIVLTGIIQSLIGLLHFYIFPEIVTGAFAFVEHKLFYVDSINGAKYLSRESGTLGNAIQYANFISIACYALYCSKPRLKYMPNTVNTFLYFSLFLLLLAGIMPSLSRIAVVFAFIYLAMNFFRNIYLSIILGTSALAFLFYKYPQFIDRIISLGNFGRSQKNSMAIDYLTSSWKFFVFGVPNWIRTSLRTSENIGFGDNSFLHLMLKIGFPMLALWTTTLLYYFKKLVQAHRLIDYIFFAYVISFLWFSELIHFEALYLFMLSLIFCFCRNEEKLERSTSPVLA